MKINWKVRMRKKSFVLAVAGLVGIIAVNYFGVDAGEYETIVNAIMLVLITGGIVIDPTTSGINDSERALSYKKPRKDADK